MRVTDELRKLLEEMEYTSVEPIYDSKHYVVISDKWNDQCKKLHKILKKNYN